MKSPFLETNFKSAFSYYSAFHTAAKIDFARATVARGKADRKRLLRL
jgi:hypothetical protein